MKQMKPKEVIFLDFDGVLNNAFFFVTKKPKKYKNRYNNFSFMKNNIDIQNIKVLKYILEQLPNVKIIISSAWGGQFELGLFQKLFKEFKINKSRIIDITPRKMSSQRCHEIGLALYDYPSIQKWLAIDDHAIYYLDSENKPNEYLVDSKLGLNYNDAIKIIKHFNPDWKEKQIYL